MIITDIKNAIKTKLDALVTAGTLGEVQEDDFSQGIFSRDFAKFPAAVLTSPAMTGIALTNRSNERTYTFNVVIIQKGENIASATDIETLMESIVDAFDNDPTLGGKADGGVEPSASQPEAVAMVGKTYIAFVITIKANAVKDLTFT